MLDGFGVCFGGTVQDKQVANHYRKVIKTNRLFSKYSISLTKESYDVINYFKKIRFDVGLEPLSFQHVVTKESPARKKIIRKWFQKLFEASQGFIQRTKDACNYWELDRYVEESLMDLEVSNMCNSYNLGNLKLLDVVANCLIWEIIEKYFLPPLYWCVSKFKVKIGPNLICFNPSQRFMHSNFLE